MRHYFNRYPYSERRSIKHYKQNISLAEAFGPSLSIFEVSLRNALIRELERMSGKEWYKAFRTHSILKSLYKYITTASNHIKARGEQVTADKINGELTMGFWVSLFNAEYEKYLWKDLRRAFPNMPKSERQRKNLSAPLNAIRSLRNRVFHNEAISWNLSRLESLHEMILQVIKWINPDLSEWTKDIDRFKRVMFKTRIQRLGW